MPIATSMPSQPVIVAVCTVEPDGSHRKRANMLVDEAQVGSLVDAGANPLRDHAVRSLAAALHLDHLPIRMARAPVSAPVILAS